MTMIYEFDYVGNVDMDVADRLAQNFWQDPTGFVHPMEWDETLLVDIQEVEDNDGP